MSAFFDRIIERRIPQSLVIYVGVSWGIMQFTKFMVDVFLLSPHWTKVAIYATLMLWPCYLCIVYNHGRPGPDKWTFLDKIWARRPRT